MASRQPGYASVMQEYKSVRNIHLSSSSFFLRNLSLPSSSSSSLPEDSPAPKMERKVASFVSRTGRHLQRYNNGCRQVVGCIPYRYRRTKQSASVDGASNGELEVLVVSSQKGQAMMFPKGGWESDESIEAAALRETAEEAGVRGFIEDNLGKYIFKSKSQGTRREGYMFSLLVNEELDLWPEKHTRRRVWMKASDAREVCQYSWMREALDKLVQKRMPMPQRKEDWTAKDIVAFPVRHPLSFP